MMKKYFVALIGESNVGKTKTLDKIIDTSGIRFSKNAIRGICRFTCFKEKMLVFVLTSSPQERQADLNEEIKHFENAAKRMGLDSFCILMAFTNRPRKKNEIKNACNTVKNEGYTLKKIYLKKELDQNSKEIEIKSTKDDEKRQAKELLKKIT